MGAMCESEVDETEGMVFDLVSFILAWRSDYRSGVVLLSELGNWVTKTDAPTPTALMSADYICRFYESSNGNQIAIYTDCRPV